MFSKQITAAVCALFAAAGASAQSPAQAPLSVTARANGAIAIDRANASTVRVLFVGSPILTTRMERDLAQNGFAVTTGQDAAATVTIDGNLRLSGGPKFTKPAIMPLGKVLETELDTVINRTVEERTITRAEAFALVTDVALVKVALDMPMGNFMTGLQLAHLGDSLGKITGVSAFFNKAVSGDPRGICFSNCDKWNEVDQTVTLTIEYAPAGATPQTVRVLARAQSETLAPDQVISAALQKAVEAITFTKAQSP